MSDRSQQTPRRRAALCALIASTTLALVFALAAEANAAIYQLRPDSTVSNNWLVVGAPTNWDAINDPVTQPTAVTSSEYIYAGGVGRVSDVGLTTRMLSSEAPSSGRAWFYANTGASTETKMEVVWGGVVRATYTLAPGAPFAWRSVAVTPPTQGAIDDLRLRFRTPVGDNSNVRAAYFELETVFNAMPETTITSAPPVTTTSTSASFSFTSDDASAAFECKLDTAAWEECTSPKTYTGLALGEHLFRVKARDSVGQRDPTPASHTWTVVGTCTPAFGSFAVDSWPPACWRPYASTSPFNRALPATLTTAQIHPNSANIVARVTGWGAPGKMTAGYHDTVEDWDKPTYYPRSTDPLFSLDCTEPWGTCARSDGVPLESLQIRIPDAARPAAGGDAHLTVVDQASGWEYDFYDVTSKPAGGGTLRFDWGGATRIDGDGRGSDATAARYGNLAGIIRAQELEAGAINHALFMVIKCDSGAWVYPAMKGGRACSAIGESNTNAPPMGARFQLNMTDAEIDALAVPAWKKTLFRAMARYGMYFGDTGGGTNWNVQVESDSTYSSFGRTPQYVAFAQRNGWESRVSSSLGVTLYSGDFANDINWASKLRVVAPCVGEGTCP